jgi:hypothetical protein
MKPEKNFWLSETGANLSGAILTALQAALVAVPSAAVGALAFAKLAEACVVWYQISSREGESGFFIAGLALAGGLAGLVVGALCGWKWHGSAVNLLKGFGLAIAVILSLTASIALLCRWKADIPPTMAGHELILEVEVRLPAGTAVGDLEDAAASSLNLQRFENQSLYRSEGGALYFEKAKQSAGRWIVPGTVPLSGDRGKRVLELNIGAVHKQNFLLPMPAHPGEESMNWSDWLPQGTPEKPWPDGEMSYRYRVTVIGAVDRK